MSDPITLSLSLDDSPTLPGEFRLFAEGFVETTKGTFLFDEEAATSVMAAAKSLGNEFPIDYGHAMLSPAPADPAEAGKAAGWFVPEIRDGELWATNVTWTPRATEHLLGREYRYCSPTFEADAAGRVLRLINVALTNLPATKHMTPLMASQTVDQSRTLVALGLAETASDEEASAFTSEVRRLIALTECGQPAEAVRIVLEWKEQAARVETLARRVEALEAEATAHEVLTLVDQAMRQGQLTPAQRGWAVKLGQNDVDSLRTFLASAPRVLPMGERLVPPPGGSGSPAGVVDGQRWEDLRPVEKAALYESNRAAYEALKAAHERGGRNAW
jgi:phage I-like protein